MARVARPKPPLTDEQRAFAARHAGYAVACIRSWVIAYPALEEEFRTACFDGLFTAARSHNGTLDGRGLVARCVRFACSDARKFSRYQRRRLASEALTGEEIDPTDHRPAPPEPDAGELVDRLLSVLSPRDAAIVRAHVIEGRLQSDIAAEHGLSNAGVSRSVCDSLDRLRNHPLARALA